MMFAVAMRIIAFPGPGWGVGTVLTSGGWVRDERMRARCVFGRSVEVISAV